MHHEPGPTVPPPFPEFPAAIAAAFLTMAAICAFASFEDRYVLAAFLAVIGLTAAIVAVLTCRRAASPDATSDAHH
jgi:hypothetical protein